MTTELGASHVTKMLVSLRIVRATFVGGSGGAGGGGGGGGGEEGY